MTKHTVNIIGAGLAGLSSALTLARKGVHVNLVSPMPSERAQSVMAEGGINAAMNENDTTREHYEDTLKGGAFIGEERSIEGLTNAAPSIVEELIKLGVPFNNENGKITLRFFGGQKKNRTAYSRSSTGKIVMSAMIEAVRKYEAEGLVTRFPHHVFELLDIGDNGCKGVIIRDLYSLKAFRLNGPVIIATGGMNSLFPGLTTGTTVNTGDVTAYLYSIGVPLSNLEFIQYHPTTASIEGKRCLISEAARGEGGRLMILKGGNPWYFMEEKYPELGNLMPRDITAREIILNSEEGFAYLDMTALPSDTWENKLSDMREEIISLLGTDPVKDYVKISPGIHYFMGGIYVNEDHGTSMDGLYAAGECACRYHGANRLGGNSMLGAIYGGRIAASNISYDEDLISEVDQPYEYINFHAPSAITEPLVSAVGIIRDGRTMQKSLDTLMNIDTVDFKTGDKRRLLLAQAILTCALSREESRGSHYRTDFPEKNDEKFKAKSVITYSGNKHNLSYEVDK